MNNDLINAIVAIVEDRPADARSILRSNPGAIQTRLYSALDKRQAKLSAKLLRSILSDTLRLDALTIYGEGESGFGEAYYQGVEAVEHAIEERLKALEEET